MFDPSDEQPAEPQMSGRPLADLAQEITAGAVRLAAATAAWLRLVAEFDERGGWTASGIRSCAHWLAWQCGLGPGTAREHVRVARALRRLPLIDRAFADGRLSYAKVRALTRVAGADCEAELLESAVELTASQVERVVRQWRRADAVDAGTVLLKQQFETWWDDDGMLVLRARMPAEEGAALLTAIESLAERAARRERAQAKREQAAQARAGRSVAAAGASAPRTDPELADRCLEDDEVALARERTTARRLRALAQLAGVAVDADRRAGDPPRREVVVHVDAALLEDDAAAGRAYIEGGPPLHPAQARRMLCEATVITMLEKDREVLAVGRSKRRATRAQRRALLRRDGGCARPGCPETRLERLHAHHLRHWRYGGRTDLTNLVLLCDTDHGLAHDLDLVMTRHDRRLVVTAPDGRRVWGAPDGAFADGLAGLHQTTCNVDERFRGVQPIDTRVGRRPTAAPHAVDQGDGSRELPASERCAAPSPTHRSRIRRRTRRSLSTRGRRTPSGRRDAHRPRAGSVGAGRRTLTGDRARRRLVPGGPTVADTLFPAGEPALPEALHVNGERMDLAYVVGVLMGNRDLVRRLATETASAMEP